MFHILYHFLPKRFSEFLQSRLGKFTITLASTIFFIPDNHWVPWYFSAYVNKAISILSIVIRRSWISNEDVMVTEYTDCTRYIYYFKLDLYSLSISFSQSRASIANPPPDYNVYTIRSWLFSSSSQSLSTLLVSVSFNDSSSELFKKKLNIYFNSPYSKLSIRRFKDWMVCLWLIEWRFLIVPFSTTRYRLWFGW